MNQVIFGIWIDSAIFKSWRNPQRASSKAPHFKDGETEVQRGKKAVWRVSGTVRSLIPPSVQGSFPPCFRVPGSLEHCNCHLLGNHARPVPLLCHSPTPYGLSGIWITSEEKNLLPGTDSRVQTVIVSGMIGELEIQLMTNLSYSSDICSFIKYLLSLY